MGKYIPVQLLKNDPVESIEAMNSGSQDDVLTEGMF